MKVNFLFDEFKDDGEPWWNVCDVSFSKLERYDLYPKSFFWWRESIKKTLTYNNTQGISENEINFIQTTTSVLNKDDLNIYPVFISDKTFMCPGAVMWIPQYVVDKINEGIVYLMVANYFECDFINHDNFIHTLHNLLNSGQIKNYDYVKIVGNDFISEKLINTTNANRGKIEYINSYTFEKFYVKRLEDLNEGLDINDHIDHINKKNSFLMQIGSPRHFRFFMYKILEYGGALENAIYSYMPFDRGIITDNISYDSADRYLNEWFFGDNISIGDQLKNGGFEDFNKWLNSNNKIESRSLPDCKLENNNIFETSPYTNIDWLKETYFSFIIETQASNFNSFITEKTFKMIFCGHPFILFASPGALSELHKLGYETYPELFDESYDEMPHSFEKMFFIMNQIKKWTLPENKKELESIIQTIKPKLIKNRETYLNKDHSLFWNKFKKQNG